MNKSRAEKIQFLKDVMQGKQPHNPVLHGVAFVNEGKVFMYENSEGRTEYSEGDQQDLAAFQTSHVVTHTVEFCDFSKP